MILATRYRAVWLVCNRRCRRLVRIKKLPTVICGNRLLLSDYRLSCSGGATPGRSRSNDLAGRSTALAQALAVPCLALRITLLR